MIEDIKKKKKHKSHLEKFWSGMIELKKVLKIKENLRF